MNVFVILGLGMFLSLFLVAIGATVAWYVIWTIAKMQKRGEIEPVIPGAVADIIKPKPQPAVYVPALSDDEALGLDPKRDVQGTLKGMIAPSAKAVNGEQ